MAWNEEEEAAAVVVVVEEEEEEEALQKITKEDHATCQAHFLPNHGKKFVRSAPALYTPSHRVSAARAAPLRHSVNFAHARSLTRTLGTATSAGEGSTFSTLTR